MNAKPSVNAEAGYSKFRDADADAYADGAAR